MKNEGPFGEWTGYYASGEHPEPVLEVEAIYHRNDPIILGVPPMGQGSDEMARYRAVLRSAMLKQNLAEAGVPDVTGVWCHEIGASRLLHGVSIKQRYPGHSKQAGHIAAQCQAANYANRFIIVVDDDIDVTNLEQLIWAMCTRCDPATTIDIVKGAWTSPADPRLTPDQKASGDITNSRAIIDACKPFHWKDDFPTVKCAQRGCSPRGAGEIRLSDGLRRGNRTPNPLLPRARPGDPANLDHDSGSWPLDPRIKSGGVTLWARDY